MVSIPTTISDNFLDNPDALKEWALSLKYSSDPDNRWPGLRSKGLDILHPPFFDYLNKKILSLFFETTPKYVASLNFQLIEDYEGSGWIHQDPALITYILYLFKENETNCGTSLYNLKPNKIHYINSPKQYENTYLRHTHHQTKQISSSVQKIKDQDIEDNFDKILDVKDKYNRLMCFSSEHFHSANSFSNGTKFRLTLTGFIHNVDSSHLPIIRSKKVTL